jgi:hypothetical protein
MTKGNTARTRRFIHAILVPLGHSLVFHSHARSRLRIYPVTQYLMAVALCDGDLVNPVETVIDRDLNTEEHAYG